MQISLRLIIILYRYSLNNGKLLITPNHAYIGPSKTDLTASLPSGIIAMWSGVASAIPSGWYLCDGNNGTPDLRNRFIVGAGSTYQPGNTGGSDSVTLTTEQMPSHAHGHSLSAASAGAHTHSHSFSVSLSNLTCSSAGEHTHNLSIVTDSAYSGSDAAALRFRSDENRTTATAGEHTHTISGSGTLSGSITSGGAHTHSLSGSISNTGSGQSHENRPPYYALCFIMKG